MSHQTYWLNKHDAEFVLSAVERYDHGTEAEAEQGAEPGLDDPVYEITVIRHERNSVLDLNRDAAYPTLLAALSVDARDLRDGGSTTEEFPDFMS